MSSKPILSCVAVRREWKIVKDVVRKADLILEVVDARDPLGTRSQHLERFCKAIGKRVVIVINKADLVPREVLERWKRIIGREYPCIYISARDRLGTSILWRTLKKFARGKSYRVAVVGLPNVGKSTILNYLRGSRSAGTSPIPGYTKHSMEVRISQRIKVIDTPGIIPKMSKLELVLKSALRPEALDDPLPVAIEFVEIALKKDKGIFRKLYGIEAEEPYKLLKEFAKRRGLLLKGGRENVEEAARVIIRDWQQGRLVFYFTPEDYGLCSKN